MKTKNINTLLNLLLIFSGISISAITAQAEDAPTQDVTLIIVDNQTKFPLFVSFEAKEIPHQHRIDVKPGEIQNFSVDSQPGGIFHYITFNNAKYFVGSDVTHQLSSRLTVSFDPTPRNVMRLSLGLGEDGQYKDEYIMTLFEQIDTTVKLTLTSKPLR